MRPVAHKWPQAFSAVLGDVVAGGVERLAPPGDSRLGAVDQRGGVLLRSCPAVVDSTALGKLYTSPVSLARFEADGGTANRSNVRLELNTVFGGERAAAAVRIAAS